MAKNQSQNIAVPRFLRAANVELDHLNPHALDEYMLTSGARRVLNRIAPSLTDPAGPRSWTITGPYGTGKSSFAVFASQLFAPKSFPGTTKARSVLKTGDEDLFDKIPNFSRQFRGLVPLAVTGSREPLQLAILRGLKAAISNLGDPTTSSLARRVTKLLEHSADDSGPSDRDLLEVITSTAKAVADGIGSGLLIVIDELGKLLEYAAAHPNKSDVYVLQHLAELAARSEVPILIVTILHKDFSGYADRLSSHEKAEWEKIRGRFEDIVFEEPADEVLRLVAMARKCALGSDAGLFAKSTPNKEVRNFEDMVNQAWRLELAPAGMAKPEFVELLKQCWPIHPLVAVLLGPVFRRLSQNERSVFSFLSSREPHGLFDFFLAQHDQSTIYGLDRLYDYLWNSLGEGLYTQRNGKKWAEVESALDRLVDATPAAIAVLKMIGVISAIGGTKNIQARPDVIKLGPQNGVVDAVDISPAIKQLEEASVITTRKYNNTLSLWEGSDVDIDERVKTARDRAGTGTSLAALASRYVSLQPIVARRHSFDTGTLRYFTVNFVEASSLATEAGSLGSADGRILVVLPANVEERATVENLVMTETLAKQARILVAMPVESRGVDMCVRELASLEWVRDNTPELEGDLTARRELRARFTELQRQLDSLSTNLLVPSSLDEEGAGCEWFHKGKREKFRSRRLLNEHLSETCKTIFRYTPTVQNELVNRRELSSQAAAARRTLIQLMIEQGSQEFLSIEGHPPEMSMYLSVLHAHGIHRAGEAGWEFGPPTSGDTGMQKTWEAIQIFFDSTEKEPRTVECLYSLLRDEPFGMRNGLLPILFCAALIASDSDVALYEEGTFVAQLAIAVFERLLKSPTNFKVRRWRVSGVRATVFKQLAEMLGKNWTSTKITKRNVLDVVRPMARFMQLLPEYTKVTDQLSDQTKRVRAALAQAREPDQLLFVDLPVACGMKLIDPDANLTDEMLRTFTAALKQSLGEMQRHYDLTITDLGQSLGTAFGIAGDGAVIRERLSNRAERLRDWVAEPALKNFVGRITDKSVDERTWIETTAALVSERPTMTWRDADRAKFDISLTRIARSFRNVEVLAVQAGGATNGQMESIRIGVTTRHGDREEVVHVGPEDKAKLVEIRGRLTDAVKASGVNGRKELILAVLAEMAEDLLT